MAQNYISRGEVITLTADKAYKSGSPYRVSGFNGVALLSVESGDLLSFQLEGIFEFGLADVKPGDGIALDDFSGTLIVALPGDVLFGRAVTGSDVDNKFHCRLLQS